MLFTRWVRSGSGAFASKSALSRSLRPGKAVPSSLWSRPQPLEILRAATPPGGHRRRTAAPIPGWSSCRPCPENRPPAVAGVAPRPQSPPCWGECWGWWRPWARVLSGRARLPPSGVVLCCVSGRVRPGEGKGGLLGPLGGQGRWPPAGGQRRGPDASARFNFEGGLWRGRNKPVGRFPGFRGTVHGSVEGPLCAVRPRVVPARRTGSLIPPALSFLPSEKGVLDSTLRWVPRCPACHSRRRRRASPPAPRCPGGGCRRLVSSASAAACPSRSALPDSVSRGRGGPRLPVACRLPGYAAAPLRACRRRRPRRRWRRCVGWARGAPRPSPRAAAPFGRARPSCRPGPGQPS